MLFSSTPRRTMEVLAAFFPLFPFSFFFSVFCSLPPSAVSLPPRVCECVCCFAKFTPFAGSPLNCVIPRCGLESGWGSRINILDLTRRQAINALRGSSQTPTKLSTLQSYTTSMRKKPPRRAGDQGGFFGISARSSPSRILLGCCTKNQSCSIVSRGIYKQPVFFVFFLAPSDE